MLNRYLLTRSDQVMAAVVAAEDEYQARLVAQRSFNLARAGRAWMSDTVTVETIEVLTSDREPGVISSGRWAV